MCYTQKQIIIINIQVSKLVYMQPQKKQSRIYNSVANIRSSQIFYNIADEDMNQFFMDYIQQQQQNQQQHKNRESINNNQTTTDSQNKVDKQDHYFDGQVVNLADQCQQICIDKEVVSRLDIQVEKNGLNFISVYGQLFIMIVRGQLVSEQKIQDGKLLVTNYRFAFFKKGVKKLDLPYGFISQCKLNQKSQQIIAQLKYNHFWKLKICESKDYNHLKIFMQIYLKIQSIKSCIAFSYASKFPDFVDIKHVNIANEFIRLGVNNKQVVAIDNSQFRLCASYPEVIYSPMKISITALKRISRFWNQYRFPVLTYCHSKSYHEKEHLAGIWRSSSLICDRSEELKDAAKIYEQLRKSDRKLCVFQAGSKNNKKVLEQFQVNSQCEMRYLQTETLQNIKASYLALVQSFLVPKKSFIKDLLCSRWYDIALQFLKGAGQISNKLLNKQNVIVKCYNGRDRSAVLSALAQIIIQPYYRTIRGFQVLIQKQFQYFGFPFLNRLGLTNKKQQQCPLFIIFLDCVSQLINSNQLCFQYNYKYLSKLSNLMYTCLFGTFVTNCRKEWLENNIDKETMPIWKQLVSELTKNAYYCQKTGIMLQIPTKIDNIRIWKQHFGYLTTPPKQTYKIHPYAQDNTDYLNLHCHKIMNQNKIMQNQIQQQKKIINELKFKIAARIQQKNQLKKQ